MHIVIIMFAQTGGGIEQAFIDHCEGLHSCGQRITAIVHPNSWAEEKLSGLPIEIVRMRNFGEWDLLASHRLKKTLQKLAPDVVIVHANRAMSLARRAMPVNMPLIGVIHKYSTKRHLAADALFPVTHDLAAHLKSDGFAEDNIFHMPNMIRCSELPQRAKRQSPPVIGTMGRFVAKKGFDVYIEALAQLKARGYVFKAVLGGTGAEEKKLKRLVEEKGLTGTLQFLGWVENRKNFYTGIDIFCLPSLHEPFGIVLLEAFSFGAPVISTNSEGPKDIITPNYDALIVEKGNAHELANAMARLLDDEKLADKLAANAFAKVTMQYTQEVVCERIVTTLHTIIERKCGSKLAA